MTPGVARVPAAADVAALSDRALIALAVDLVTIDTAALARALGIARAALQHARRAPTTLPLAQRLTLAAIAGARRRRAAPIGLKRAHGSTPPPSSRSTHP